MRELLLDSLIDTLKLIPFLLVAFLVLEYIEHKMSKKNKNILTKSQKYGPIIGSILGAFPQCGFSALATNLFSKRVITLGTLIAIYLSTSDEMLPILISNGTNITIILKIILIKVIIGLIYGLLIDLFLKKKNNSDDINKEIHDMCHDTYCNCEKEGIIKSSFKHTINISLFIFISSIAINLCIYYIGEEQISHFLLKGHGISYFLSSLIGLIPNCASSVIITELYLNEMITLGNLLAGVLTGSGIGILILFRTNKNLKQNLIILFLIYIIGVISGFIIDWFGLIL